MPVSVFDEWFNHYLNEPWGYEAEVHRHAELLMTLTNGLFKLKNKAEYKEFIYPYKGEEEMDWRAMKAAMKARSQKHDDEEDGS